MDAAGVSIVGILAMLAASAALLLTLLVLALLAATKPLTRDRGRLLTWLGSASLVIGGCGFLAVIRPEFVEDFTRSRDLAALDAHSKPVIAAIQRFEQVHARPPKRLEELVPEFLPANPTTGLSRWPEYEYFYGRRASPDRWGLDVWIPKLFFDLDGNRRFQYEPDAAKDRALGATLRSGDWVYIPD